MRLLLAEDEKSLSRALTRILESSHYSVDAAYNGEEALDFLDVSSYDAVILDLMMPKVDGLTVLRTLRERNDLTPVLILTARSEVDDKVLGLDSGANDYLTKPFERDSGPDQLRAGLRGEFHSAGQQGVSADGAPYEQSGAGAVHGADFRADLGAGQRCGDQHHLGVHFLSSPEVQDFGGECAD